MCLRIRRPLRTFVGKALFLLIRVMTGGNYSAYFQESKGQVGQERSSDRPACEAARFIIDQLSDAQTCRRGSGPPRRSWNFATSWGKISSTSIAPNRSSFGET